MSEVRIIKKYPNRRLYDTAISSYITQEDVKRLVLENVNIQVIDARTKNDITHNTLLQIVMVQEESGPSIFSTQSLQKLIRVYGSTMENVIGRAMDSAMDFFANQQSVFKQGVADAERSLLNANSDAERLELDDMQNHWQKALDEAVARGELEPAKDEVAQGYVQGQKE